jgi:4-amino-4-deoxy-L-arabinose transferase-like glycosyltransferase
MRALMKRVFLSPFVALTAGLGLRLYFALKFPANSGDTLLYDQIATNWLKHHVFAMTVGGAITPVDLRMPGYPAFLAIVYALTGRTGADARLWVMLAQVIVDLCSCIFVASLASLFALLNSVSAKSGHAFLVALWLSAVCPFTANYVAVPLSEVFAVFFTSLAMLALIALIWHQSGGRVLLFRREWATMHAESIFALLAGFLVGLGTLFRPEMPLLLVSFWAVLAFIWFRRRRFLYGLRLMGLSALACLAPLAPWAIRNAITLHEIQFLAPKNSNLPGELVPYGFMAWEKTWLYRVRDCYLVSWKLNEESIDVEEIPARAFDTPEEKQRVAAILEQYNHDLTLAPEEDAAFAQLAREHTARHPLRTYLWLPAARAVAIWFTPRIELLPVSGHVFPLAQMREDDPVDQEVTSLLFVLNLFYVGLGVWGAARLWRSNSEARPAVVFLALFIVVRTAFLTTLETPEPRYVLVCFPALIAMGAQVFARRFEG